MGHGSTGPTRTTASSMTKTLGAAQAPRITRAAAPQGLPVMAKCDEDSPSSGREASGDLATTANTVVVVKGVPLAG